MKALFSAARELLSDMASTLAFVLLLAITNDVVVSVLASIGLGVAQMVWQLARRQKIELMQGMSLFLVIVSGIATLLTHNPKFVLVKPSLIYLAVGVVMLRPGWMVRYLPEDAVALVTDVATVFGFIWAGLMFVSAGVNFYAGTHMSPLTWAAFMSTYGIVSKLTLFAISYLTIRFIGRRRYMAAHPEGLAA